MKTYVLEKNGRTCFATEEQIPSMTKHGWKKTDKVHVPGEGRKENKPAKEKGGDKPEEKVAISN